jgi:hypothetical protein
MSQQTDAPLRSTGAQPTEDSESLRVAAERIRASGVLGEARLRRLFDYLVENSLAGRAPKEIAIAIDVFDKDADFDIAQDALVRVYIHKLRRALLDFATSPGYQGGPNLQMPRGEYRLRLEPQAAPAAPAAPATRSPRRGIGAVLISLALIATTLLGFALASWRGSRSELDPVRASPIWSAILNDDRPILIVIGDYYLIGDTGKSLDVQRLVREFSVNSRTDLDAYLAAHPEMSERYTDVGLRYLPPSTAFAMRNVMAVLAPANRRISVSMLSDLQPGSLATADIVYIGFVSGLGMMQDLVFTGSRFKVGESFDEIIDNRTRQSYISQFGAQTIRASGGTGSETAYRDYGIFTTFRGPRGNRIVVIAGTRDAGVRQTAEAFTGPQLIGEIGSRSPIPSSFEALLQVSAFDGVNLSGKLLLLSPREGAGPK